MQALIDRVGGLVGRAGEPHFFRTENLTVVFGGLAALTNLDLEIEEGEIVGLIGPNGAGKTTAFNAITAWSGPQAARSFFSTATLQGGEPRVSPARA